MSNRIIAAFLACLFLLPGIAHAKRLRFSGYDFEIKQGKGLGPGPNDWARSQVSVDTKGRLHLRLSQKDGKWYSAEVSTVSRLGFGTYEIDFEGDIAGLDKDVVFGFFHYPTANVGPDGTNEIDIEFSRWGDPRAKPLNYTVWPSAASMDYAHRSVSFPVRQGRSIHRYSWSKDKVRYHSAEIKANGRTGLVVEWDYKPGNPQKRIAQKPMPLFFNLWGRKGLPPSDGKSVEVIINSFKFTPEPK